MAAGDGGRCHPSASLGELARRDRHGAAHPPACDALLAGRLVSTFTRGLLRTGAAGFRLVDDAALGSIKVTDPAGGRACAHRTGHPRRPRLAPDGIVVAG